MHLRIEPNLLEYRQLAQGAEEFTGQHGFKINYLLAVVVKLYAQGI